MVSQIVWVATLRLNAETDAGGDAVAGGNGPWQTHKSEAHHWERF